MFAEHYFRGDRYGNVGLAAKDTRVGERIPFSQIPSINQYGALEFQSAKKQALKSEGISFIEHGQSDGSWNIVQSILWMEDMDKAYSQEMKL